MKKMTYKGQLMVCAGIHAVLLVFKVITKQGIFSNIAWVVWGAAFILHPVWPGALDRADHDKLRLGCRIGGVLAILFGLLVRFRV